MSEVQMQFERAIADVKKKPSHLEGWDEVEQLAAELDSPDEVAGAYAAVLAKSTDKKLASVLGQRAVAFHEEWFGADSAGLPDVLSRVLAIDPGAEWAFQRLTSAHTVAERWPELFALYDQALTGARKEQRLALLEEAYQTAKDLANDPERAILYLHELNKAKPDAKRSEALAKLLERHGRWAELIEVWQTRLPDLHGADQMEARIQIARTWLRSSSDPAQSLEALRQAISGAGTDAPDEIWQLLEEILVHDQAAPETRKGALTLLTEHYDKARKPRDAIRLLQMAMNFPDADRKALRLDIAHRLSDLNDPGAVDHYAALLLKDPTSVSLQKSLRRSTQAAGELERYVTVLAEAADACKDAQRRIALLVEAARTRLDTLEDEKGAIPLFQRALATDGISQSDVLAIGRRLNELLGRSGQHRERLAVLETLASAESVASSQRALIGDIAQLSCELGEIDRALDAWRRRLELDPHDLAALDAMVDLLDSEGRSGALIETLRRRATTTSDKQKKRADLVRVAQVYERELGNPAQAIQAWLDVIKQFGDDPFAVQALAKLMAEAERWKELVELLERVNKADVQGLSERYANLGMAYNRHLGEPRRAVESFARCLSVDPQNPGAHAGLNELLDNPTERRTAADILARACLETQDWSGYLDLVEPRLADTNETGARLSILLEAADIRESKLGDQPAALALLCRAFPLVPADRGLEERLIKLARQTKRWPDVLRAYQLACAEIGDADPRLLARLRFREARLCEEEQEQPDAAFQAFTHVIELEPSNLPATAAAIRLGAAHGQWDDVARALCRYASSSESIEESLLKEMQTAANAANDFDSLCRSLETALGVHELAPRETADILWWLARWHSEFRKADDDAERVLTRLIAVDPRREGPLRMLVSLQRRHPNGDLLRSLQTLCDLAPGEFALLREAAELTISLNAEGKTRRSVFGTLYSRARAAWNNGDGSAREQVVWAVDQLVDAHCEMGDHRGALDLLMEASRLPFEESARAELRLTAARIAMDNGDENGAIEMYRSVLAQTPGDATAIAQLGALYRSKRRLPELLALQKHQLALNPRVDERLTLRLELAETLAEIEREGGRVAALRANLNEEPGHVDSLVALTSVLETSGRHNELVLVLTDQAARLEERADSDRAAAIWVQVADLAEYKLNDRDTALTAHQRVVDLTNRVESLDALARLHVDSDRYSEAVPWLERRLAQSEGAERARVAGRLARAHLGADRPERAAICLQRALSQGYADLSIRRMLADLHRQRSEWEPLADLLTSSLPEVTDSNLSSTWSVEAADLYHGALRTPEKAVPALERALSHDPDNRKLRLQYAVSLRANGQLDEARATLEALVAGYGRRRSAERAAVHVELAHVARTQGKLDEAVAELEQASGMDANNAHTLRTLAAVARETGNLEQAERSLRGLLLLVRREQPGDDDDAVGPAEVFYEMYTIAQKKGDDAKAAELLESVTEAAVQNEAESRRLQRTMLAHGEAALFVDILRKRLAAVEGADLKGRAMSDLADVLERALDKKTESFDTRLEVLRIQPQLLDNVQRARKLAVELTRSEDFMKEVEEVAETLRRDEEQELAGELVMMLGATAEADLGDAERAHVYYARAEQHRAHRVEALYALARTGSDAEREQQQRALEELKTIALEDKHPGRRADALYRVAELELLSSPFMERGLETLDKAVRTEPRYGDAGAVLKKASEVWENAPAVLELYEQVARGSRDSELLLDYLERQARSGHATPEQIREACELAARTGDPERGNALLEQAVEMARGGDGISSVGWAMRSLIKNRTQSGELGAARDLLLELASFDEWGHIEELGLVLAGIAAADKRPDRLSLAAEVYEFMREREPQSRGFWEPLFGIYQELGAPDRLLGLVMNTLPLLMDTGDRNLMRRRSAAFFLAQEKSTEAKDLLKNALSDDPDDHEAAVALEAILRKEDDLDALTDFLSDRYDDALKRGVPETVAEVAVQFGGLLADFDPKRARKVYTRALELAPQHLRLLRTALDLLDKDKDAAQWADLMERRIAVEEERVVPGLALSLAAQREEQGDTEGTRRALETGYRRNTSDSVLKKCLQDFYRDRELWASLAEMMIHEAESGVSNEVAIQRLREAARIYRDDLSDRNNAARVLYKACQLDAENVELLCELAACQNAAGDAKAAIHTLSDALGKSVNNASRTEILLLRSDLQESTGKHEAAVTDLEAAFQLDPQRIQPRLAQSLDKQRVAAQEQADIAGERKATLRLVSMSRAVGALIAARELLLRWIDRYPEDREALLSLRDMDEEAENWEGVITACGRLALIEEGDQQVDAALRLYKAAEQLGTLSQARATLEHVVRVQPQRGILREFLRHIYQECGLRRELAQLLLTEGEHAEDEESKYAHYRNAADIFVNELGDPEAALPAAQKAQELRPDDHDTIIVLADVLTASGRTDEAMAILEPAINKHKKRSPELASLQYRMSRIYAVLGDQDTQLYWLKKAFDVDRKDGVIAAELAQLATAIGDYDLALKPLRAITLMDSPGPVTRVMALLWEAKIEHARGNRAKAELWAKKALREDPTFQEAAEFLDQIAE